MESTFSHGGVGLLSVFAPQGIGIFELLASELMTGRIGFMGFAALVVGFRGVALIADLIVWVVYQAIRRGLDRKLKAATL